MEKNPIIRNLDNPEGLENLYRSNPRGFREDFMMVYPQISSYNIADFWKIRLQYEDKPAAFAKADKRSLFFLVASCLLAVLLIRLPAIAGAGIQELPYYQKNAALIVFVGMSLFMVLSEYPLNRRALALTALVILFTAFYINILPPDGERHSVILAYIHLPLFLWALLGLIFMKFNLKDLSLRTAFLKYSGDLAVMTGILIISGVVFSALTISLFSVTGMDIESFYEDNIAGPGLVSIPIVALFVLRVSPSVTSRIAHVIARIFTPLVLIAGIIYLAVLLSGNRSPFTDRDFLMVVNLILVAVMAIIIFSVTGTGYQRTDRFSEAMLLCLALLTVVINGVALSAIIYRLGEYGFSPNKTAVLGVNILIFVHLILIAADLLRVNFRKTDIGILEKTISRYLPVYFLWIVTVIFGFPLIFGFR